MKILECLKEHPDITTIVAALESTSVYSIHIANYLSSCEELMRFKPYVFVLNPKCTANYKKSYIGLGKSDPIDALLLQTMQELETLNPSLGVAASFWL